MPCIRCERVGPSHGSVGKRVLTRSARHAKGDRRFRQSPGRRTSVRPSFPKAPAPTWFRRQRRVRAASGPSHDALVDPSDAGPPKRPRIFPFDRRRGRAEAPVPPSALHPRVQLAPFPPISLPAAAFASAGLVRSACLPIIAPSKRPDPWLMRFRPDPLRRPIVADHKLIRPRNPLIFPRFPAFRSLRLQAKSVTFDESHQGRIGCESL